MEAGSPFLTMVLMSSAKAGFDNWGIGPAVEGLNHTT